MKKDICAILILIFYDVSAARKICSHISVLVSYHRYEKKVNYKNQQYNFTRIDDFDNQFFSKNPIEYCQNATK